MLYTKHIRYKTNIKIIHYKIIIIIVLKSTILSLFFKNSGPPMKNSYSNSSLNQFKRSKRKPFNQHEELYHKLK